MGDVQQLYDQVDTDQDLYGDWQREDSLRARPLFTVLWLITLAVIGIMVLRMTPNGLDGKKYISARLTTKRSWTYGKIEMRAKLPAGRGTWPAFWMLPAARTSDNLLDGEIDIMEYVGCEPGIVWFSLHNKKDRTDEGKNLLTTSLKVESPETEWHTYGVEWTAEYIQAYVDGIPYYTFRNDGSSDPQSWPFDKPFNIKLNVAVGGSWGGYMGVDDSIFPAEYIIDYVRVYQR